MGYYPILQQYRFLKFAHHNRAQNQGLFKNFYAWLIAIPSGLAGFVLIKKLVDNQRKQELKALQQLERSK